MSDVSSDMAANFWRAWWAWLICFFATITISLFTKKKPKEELVGLVKGLTPETIDKDLKLIQKPEFWAIISLVVFLILNIYYW
jgi:SSS family solute:Na+ symporter